MCISAELKNKKKTNTLHKLWAMDLVLLNAVDIRGSKLLFLYWLTLKLLTKKTGKTHYSFSI